jgi:hypothetical protein
MATPTTNLNAEDCVILFCVATGISPIQFGIPAQAMRSMAVRGFIEHQGATQAYVLTASGRATLRGILKDELL